MGANSLNSRHKPKATLIPWASAKRLVLEKYPKARIVWSHGGRVVLLHESDSPTTYQQSVSEAWRWALQRIAKW